MLGLVRRLCSADIALWLLATRRRSDGQWIGLPLHFSTLEPTGIKMPRTCLCGFSPIRTKSSCSGIAFFPRDSCCDGGKENDYDSQLLNKAAKRTSTKSYALCGKASKKPAGCVAGMLRFFATNMRRNEHQNGIRYSKTKYLKSELAAGHAHQCLPPKKLDVGRLMRSAMLHLG